jgi:hypothetical protein
MGQEEVIETIRLFVGCAAWADAESQAVLEYTARSLSSLPIDLIWMSQQKKGFWSGWNTKGWKTPFTGYRWGIPAYCGYGGRAIYTDSDFIFRADLAELWRQPIPNALLLNSREGKLNTSAILFDCAACQPFIHPIDALKASVGQDKIVRDHLRHHRELIGEFEGDWNAVDLKRHADITDPSIKAIHYSRMEVQPHLTYAQKRLAAEGQSHWYTGPTGPHWRTDLIALFDQLLVEATANGYPVERYRTSAPPVFERSNFTYTHSKVVA